MTSFRSPSGNLPQGKPYGKSYLQGLKTAVTTYRVVSTADLLELELNLSNGNVNYPDPEGSGFLASSQNTL
jgi:hypothetical protein